MTTLSPDQRVAIDMIQQWHRDGGEAEFRMGGLAGTGKTTIIGALPDVLGLKYGDLHYCAPTGKAASVLTRKLPSPYVATTIHRLMYRPMEAHCDACKGDPCHGMNSRKCAQIHPDSEGGRARCNVSFQWAPPDYPPKLVIVDEASMVGASVYTHLMEIGTQVLFVGDHGQLPPVEGSLNLMEEARLDVKLERIHRQAEKSPIIHLAHLARQGEIITPGEYGPGVRCILGSRVLTDGFDADADSLLLCYTNDERMRLNRMMRQALGFTSPTPVPGDKVVCLKNNASKGIANGMLGIVENVVPFGPAFYDITIRLLDEDRTYTGRCLAQQFEEKDTLFMRDIDLWTYGYCLTTHKAQGSEADDVVVFQEWQMKYMSPDERRRWLYTAITRAKSSLTLFTPVMRRRND